jgi:outer membrane protein OmpA-like peptidoglycan-associated protein
MVAIAVVFTASVAGCANRQVGYEVERSDLGYDVRNNSQVQIAALRGDHALLSLSKDFRRSVVDMVNFAFASSQLDAAARQILDQQAVWILAHPLVRLRIYGHTDLVGGYEYNLRLGQRRADAVAAYLVSRGVGANRLEAVVSLGKTRPLVPVDAPEVRNRRTVTEVVGYVPQSASFDFDGKRAHQVYQDYVSGDTSEPPSSETPQAIFISQ